MRKLLRAVKNLVVFFLWLIVVTSTFLVANYVYFNYSSTEFHPDYKLPGKMINIEGRNVHYIEKGAGPDLILIHDIGGSAESFMPVIDKLSKRFHVLVPDLLGHGYTDKPKDVPYSIQTYDDFLVQFLSALKINKASFLAHGNSSRVVNEFLNKHPERVNKVVYVDNIFFKTSFIFNKYLSWPLAGEAFVTIIDRWMMKKNLYDFGYYNSLLIQEKMVDLLSKYWGIPGVKYSYLKTAHEFQRVDYSEVLYSKAKRGIIVLSERNYQTNYNKIKVSDLEKEVFPWKIYVLEKTGYFSFLERPDDFAALIMMHL
ncbi:MAG: hypothetical protein DKM50_08935 [Candidatus Margulisiibacteriota bacterium]|nr:MAG: hypothetical protein A2X43_04515 [Candidatus Margulisbacteria bacterium GWD2_39_127]OGI04119.1 MAG: hypothetical protein A2X42_04650 [Candidatus Margulisbacteria bacterium GWF2_38_17]OGI05970.1 MAG: hypothetical protein A2X41_12160 [Candidatus Margulisbacteria bacterium GWE2_39_32]PZM79574.1 MAG: hypothetical protein DKM50_08935 [Candidatus Margulisiibacteriota bacterium]HAR63374.1 hypothetical protein [Candidatus Margulisiibacteriota bacterium]